MIHLTILRQCIIDKSALYIYIYIYIKKKKKKKTTRRTHIQKSNYENVFELLQPCL